MTNETEMYPPEMKQEIKECYCCHKVKEGILIPIANTNDNCEHRFICNDCNHLKPKEAEKCLEL